MPRSLELLTVGRVSVDLYADEAGAGFDGSATVRQVGRRHGHQRRRRRRPARAPGGRADEGRRRPVRPVRPSRKLVELGVDIRFVGIDPRAAHAARLRRARRRRRIPSCSSTASRRPRTCSCAPDDVDLDVVPRRPVLWVAGSAMAEEPARATVVGLLAARGRRPPHRARPRLPASAVGRPPTTPAGSSAPPSTRRRSPSATGPSARSPSARPIPSEAARRLLDRGVEHRRRQARRRRCAGGHARGVGRRGAPSGRGRLRARRRRRVRRRLRARPARRAGRRRAASPTPTPPVRSSRRASCAPTPCRPTARSTELLEPAQ